MKRLSLLLLMNACAFLALAQIPTTPGLSIVDPHPGQGPDVRICAATTWQAGTSEQALDPGNQNTVPEPSGTEFYLCFNDILNITHNGDFNLDTAEDPYQSTPPGISYIFYDCPPTVSGVDLTNIEADPCVTPSPTSPFIYLDVVVDIGGSGDFVNNGALQSFFAAGDPVAFYFAPITVHEHFNPSSQRPEFEAPTNTDDYCVNANPADAFRVVYLNEIVISSISNNNGGNACSGSFDVAGGLPEFEWLSGGGSDYTISIVKSGDPSVVGTVTSGGATHGSNVIFTVPEPGTYDIMAEDGKSCGALGSVDMAACIASMSAIFTPTNVTCNGDGNGAIEVEIVGGVSPFTIDWQLLPGGATQSGILNSGNVFDITALSGGTYQVTVTDTNGDTFTEPVVVDEPGALGVNLVQNIPSCNGGDDGSITAELTVDGVIVINPNPADYNFNWGVGFPDAATITGLSFGPYSVIVTDANGCSATAATTLSQPAPITAGPIAGTNASCVGVDNGIATINANGGTPPLSYAWSSSASVTNTASDLSVDNHTVTVTDANGCTYVDDVVIQAATNLSVGVIAMDVTCFGNNNGQISAQQVVIGVDNGNYSFNWAPSLGNVSTANNLGPNTYTVTITDGAGCTATNEGVINEPTLLTATATAQNESCNVGNDGSVTVNATGGTLNNPDYGYNWSIPSANVPTITGLSGGTYTVTVTDDNGCTTTAFETVVPPNGPTILSFDINDILCADVANGTIRVNAVQGNDVITNYEWSNGINGTAEIINLGPDIYTVTVTDAGGCMTSQTVTLTAPPALVEASPAVITRPFCPGSGEGSITMDIGGGIPPYNYTWSNSASGPAFFELTNITAGTYTVTVTDANNCMFVVSDILVEDPNPIIAIFDDISPVSCNGGVPCDGQASISASGGSSINYTYTWDNGETGPDAVQLCQGSHVVTVSDGFCEIEVTMTGVDTIPAPSAVTVLDVLVDDATCFGDTDGSATVTPTGGSGAPYDIIWSNAQMGSTAINLDPNQNYTITITDQLGCESLPFQISVDEPDSLELVVVDTIDVTCNGDNDAIIQVAPIGGNQGNFTYEWSNGITETTNTIAGLAPGSYNVTVTDSEGCTATTVAEVTEPSPITFDFIQPDQPECNGYTTIFSALQNVSGGSGEPYLYTIDGFNFNPTSQPTEILAGTYELEVIDGAGVCSATEELIINEPPPIIVDLGTSVELQLGVDYEIIPDVTPLGALDTLVWSPAEGLSCTDCLNPTASPTDDITYTLLVTDSNGCSGSGTLFVDVDPNRNVYIPNIFSPNGDETNDYFQPYVGPGVTNIRSMMVFDRWGELVFENANFLPDDLGTDGWNGKFNGDYMNPAVFVYVIYVEFADGEERRYKGDVTLAR